MAWRWSLNLKILGAYRGWVVLGLQAIQWRACWSAYAADNLQKRPNRPNPKGPKRYFSFEQILWWSGHPPYTAKPWNCQRYSETWLLNLFTSSDPFLQYFFISVLRSFLSTATCPLTTCAPTWALYHVLPEAARWHAKAHHQWREIIPGGTLLPTWQGFSGKKIVQYHPGQSVPTSAWVSWWR